MATVGIRLFIAVCVSVSQRHGRTGGLREGPDRVAVLLPLGSGLGL